MVLCFYTVPPGTVIAWTREHGLLRDPASASQYSQISDAGDNDPSPRGQPSADPRGLLQLSPDWSTVVTTQQSSMPRLVSSSQDVDAATSLRCSCHFAGCVSLRGSSTSCVYWWIAADMVQLRNTWPAASNACPMSWLSDIYVRQQHHNWSYQPPAVQHSETGRSRHIPIPS